MPRPSAAPPESIATSPLRRRNGAGCVHPVYVEGRVTARRGLASDKDPETGRQRRRSVTRRTKAAADFAKG